MTSTSLKSQQGLLVLATIFAISLLYFSYHLTRETQSAVTTLNQDDGLLPPATAPARHNLHLGYLQFGQILVVNRPQRTDRRESISLAAAYKNMRLDWIPGISGSDILASTIPLAKDQDPPPEAAVIARNLSSALIMEDDMDWDIRIHNQLRDFAASTRALLQPLASDPNSFADLSYPEPLPIIGVTNIPFEKIPDTVPPASSLYEDGWDVLWLGHYGISMVAPDNPTHSKGRVVHKNDLTVPLRSKLDMGGGPNTLIGDYPDHTRVILHVDGGVCSTAYAVSQRGARRILWEMSVNRYTSPVDVMLHELCNGQRELKLTCLTITSNSDISHHGDGWRDIGKSSDIRWSMRMNMPEPFKGDTND
ncbi:glycosyltransferase family 25 protein [Lentithecium fluviatile CBS 122367]|uniref:Glycosyltransferase family 25 protein n=1 Tax=Lentithecium fluviatile CBS 122367 TaxID=1168545 RepID=A0A6G1IJ61_9PLEO|nr:glycosyltransferase family 25 protein [Lentithecium fluviatile CBS 122367]